MLFFIPLGRWTRGLAPTRVLLLAMPWALLTSTTEYYLWLPWAQLLFVMQQPYWPGLGAHVISASLYPLFPWLRDVLAGRRSRWRRFARVWITAAVIGAATLGGATWLGVQSQEPPQLSVLPADPQIDRQFLRMMTFHHELGIMMARQASDRANDPQLRKLAELMIADQSGEAVLMRRWWHSRVGPSMLPLSPEEHATMPGMPTPTGLLELADASGPTFDASFVQLMSRHHAGAIFMAETAIEAAVVPRVRLMAQGIRHAQHNQIAMMDRLLGGNGLGRLYGPGRHRRRRSQASGTSIPESATGCS